MLDERTAGDLGGDPNDNFVARLDRRYLPIEGTWGGED